MHSFVGVVALSYFGASATNVESTQSCNVDFTKNGMPVCFQVCQEWCWATVIGEFKEYYLKRNTNDTPFCRKKECNVVSKAIGRDCCTPLNPSEPEKECGGGSDVGTCGGPAEYSTILSQLTAEIPSQKWVQTDGPPSEAQLQQILLSGSPVGRAGSGHIDAVVGCRPCQGGPSGCPKGSGGHEYRLIDSLVDPEKEMWLSYNIVVHPSREYNWHSSYYSSGSAETNASGTVSSNPRRPPSLPQPTIV